MHQKWRSKNEDSIRKCEMKIAVSFVIQSNLCVRMTHFLLIYFCFIQKFLKQYFEYFGRACSCGLGSGMISQNDLPPRLNTCNHILK